LEFLVWKFTIWQPCQMVVLTRPVRIKLIYVSLPMLRNMLWLLLLLNQIHSLRNLITDLTIFTFFVYRVFKGLQWGNKAFFAFKL
jgi:hypothetical protein